MRRIQPGIANGDQTASTLRRGLAGVSASSAALPVVSNHETSGFSCIGLR
jgi:hypothetical protein